MITNASGREDRNFYFVFEDQTQVYYSCTLTWKNELFVFGGSPKKTQVSKIVGCRLEPVGELLFDHYYGGCANVDNYKIYLCFNSPSNSNPEIKKCRVTFSPTGNYEEISESSHTHHSTRIAASERKKSI